MPVQPTQLKQLAAFLIIHGTVPLHCARMPLDMESVPEPPALGTLLSLGTGTNFAGAPWTGTPELVARGTTLVLDP